MSGDGRPAEAAKVIDFFFNSLYASAAEPLGRDDAIEHKAVLDPDCLHGETAWDDPQADELLAWAPDRPPVELHAQFAALTSTPDADVGLPVRYLGHAPLRHYYWMFCAGWDSTWADADFRGGKCNANRERPRVLGSGGRGFLPCPGFRTFQRRWTAIWKFYLRIRKASQHSQCTTCFELSRAMELARNGMADRYRAALALRQHYRDQYTDRCLYWSLRHASRLKENVLVIIIDAMDKAKFAWPRYPWAKTSKARFLAMLCLDSGSKGSPPLQNILLHGPFVSLSGVQALPSGIALCTATDGPDRCDRPRIRDVLFPCIRAADAWSGLLPRDSFPDYPARVGHLCGS